jgi:iron complex outermembrane receptor protein
MTNKNSKSAVQMATEGRRLRNTTKRNATLASACAAIGLLAGSAAYSDPADSDQLVEITVTAQRHVEDVQKVPIAVVPITPDQALQAGAIRTDQLAQLVPGMQMGHEINAATTFIRGIGPNSNGTGEESSVAVYFDDLYIVAGDASIFNLNGISGIDVLKGPQGTLFGRNSTGGVVQVHTKDPSFDNSADFEGGFGNFNTISGNLYATGKVIDHVLATNFSAYVNDQRGGWGHDVFTNEVAFTAEDWGVRNKWLWTPTSATRVLLSGAFISTRSEVGMGFNQIPGFVAPGGHGYCPGEGGVDGNPQTSPVAFACPGPPGATYVGWYNNTDYKNDVALNKHTIVELRIDQDFSFAKGVSITGWQNMTGYAQFNQDSSQYADVQTLLNQKSRTFTQELQLISPDNASYASRFTWIAGLFYMDDNSGYGPNAQLAGISFGFPQQFVPPNYYIALNDNVRTTSYAAYAQGTALIFADTHLTLGARYTHDERLFTGGLTFSEAVPGVGGLPLCVVAPVACPTTSATPGAEHSWPLESYRVALDHQFTDDVMAYLSYNRGEKSGQYDTFGTAAGGPANNPPVNPETLTSVEAGVKSEWLDHHLQVNVSAFHYNVSNLQMAVIVAGGTKLINAASAQVNGGEFAIRAIPMTHLTLTSGISILYGHYSSFENAPDYFPPNAYFLGSNISANCPYKGNYTCNASGLDMIRAPHFSANLAADYVIPSSVGNFNLNANWSYTDTFFWFPDQSMRQPVVNLFNASVKWTNPTGRYDVRLWGSNLTNAQYYSFGSETIGFGQQFSPEAPRTYGITLGVHF